MKKSIKREQNKRVCFAGLEFFRLKAEKILMAATVIALMMTMAVTMTSCTDDNDSNPVPAPTDTAEPTELTEDALTVTIDGNYVAYGELNDGIAAALQRRLQGTITSPMDADCFVINPTGLGQLDMSMEEWKSLVRKIDTGEGSVVLTQCSFINFYNFVNAYISTSLYMQQENYQGDSDAEAQARALASRRIANIVRNAYTAGGQADGAMTRGTEVNGQELDWEHIDQWPKEKQMATMFDAYARCGDNEIYVLNANASKYLSEEVPEQPNYDYEWGQKADAIADWMNRQTKDDAETRSGLSDFRRAVTRAGGSTAIKDLMDAQTKEFVFDYKAPRKRRYSNNSTDSFYSAIKVQYTAYSAYDFGGNVEYYQVRQNITVMNDKIFNENWWGREEDGDWKWARGAWMKSIDTKMWLDGSGTKSIVSAAPLNENGTSSGSSTTGGSSATTEGWSVSEGLSAGFSAGFMAAEINASYNYAHTTDHSTTNEISWNTTTNWSTKDLTTTFTQGNDANGTVTWKHIGNVPANLEIPNGYNSNDIKQLLKKTCITDEQTLWRIDNPLGTYTLKANINVVSEIIKIKQKQNGPVGYYDRAFVTQDNPHDISFELNAPNRFKAKWNNVIYDYGSVTGDIQLTHYLDEYIEKTYGNNSANFCWAGLFVTTETTANGSDNARAVFQTFKNSITGMKVQLYQKGFRGQLVFGLKRDGLSSLTDKIVFDLDNLFQEGETLTEEVNGYELTFKVTKKNEEVELISVPDNYVGNLVIPEQIVAGIHLKVTSLGNNSAIERKGITTVTIPSTIRTIGNDALSDLNITEINIPEGVQTIGRWSFYRDKQLTKVYLPSTVTGIKNYAFYKCNAITEIHIKATTPPSVGFWGLYFTKPAYDNATLYVPKGCKDTYAQDIEWGHFNIVEE